MSTNTEIIGGPRKYMIRSSVITVVRESSEPSPHYLNIPQDASMLGFKLIPDDDREHFGIFILNNKNKLLTYHEVSVGTLNASLVHPREVIGPLLLFKAAGFVCIHNHPSGDPQPSPEDIAVTKKLKECADLFDIRLMDHVIIGNGIDRHYSFADHGLL